MKRIHARMLVGLAVGVVMGAGAPVALASGTTVSSLTVTPSSTAAGTAVSLTTDIKFTNPSGDTPGTMTLALPPGLLSSASMHDGTGTGYCVEDAVPTSGSPDASCQVGSGTAYVSLGGSPIPTPISLYLYAPEAPGALASLDIYEDLTNPAQALGTPGQVFVNPNGALSLDFTLPSTFLGLNITLEELSTTFGGSSLPQGDVRMPTSCPSTPAPFTVTATGKNAGDTPSTASAPVDVTGCSSLAFTPGFTVSATEDAADTGAQVITDITQPYSTTAPQATAGTVALTLPPSTLGPNPAALGKLCSSPTFSGCTSIGTVSATSPLYPTPLSGQAYLTGSVSSLGISLVFPAPFALTLTGAVNLATGTTTFSNVPDQPLTNLAVTLDGVFSVVSCSGTASATLTPQTGGPPATTVTAPFTVSACRPPSTTTPPPTTTTPPPTTTTPPGTQTPPGTTVGPPHIVFATLSGLRRHAPVLRFRMLAGTNGPKLKTVSVGLPHGLGWLVRRKHGKLTGVAVTGGHISAIKFVHGRLVITLRQAVDAVTVTVSALTERTGLRHSVDRRQVRRAELLFFVTDASGGQSLLSRTLGV